MRIPTEVHTSQPWRIREIAPDFIVEDVWALPVTGGADDFPALVRLAVATDPTEGGSLPVRALWLARDLLGRLFGLGRVATPEGNNTGLPIPGTDETSLADRLPEDLKGTVDGLDFGRGLFVPLYRTDREFAAEISNQTVHGVLHLAWADQGGGRFQGQMTVYVKPRGRLGQAYMAFIKPFRYLVVYPAMMRRIEHTWANRRAS